MKWLSFVFVASVLLVNGVVGEDDVPDFSKMKNKELKKLLAERGVECKGCAEKADMVSRVAETYHMPIIKVAEEKPKPKKSEDKKKKDEDIDELLKNLNSKMPGGMGNMKVFKPEDFMNNPDLMNEL
ncbi:hypothetical protein CYMTET_21222 [Cymbomonas tetramitiformis]|uniref:SAP domain-containing protein n=1 Tax=Cymbomonas tetramitiformis TaxID=36881 RepID=A0AAE0C0L4_9CHLO|nr:hypothetical protein CYMTET_44261 [Cymbomonas tetramitiformis]KAK3270380.1 hypothetical protein CYMTET_21222 [Cymbomonas tetramitiformis]|eukprot:gene7061-8423_t